jgi:hypothetical protein
MDEAISERIHLRTDDNELKFRLDNNNKIPKLSKPTTTLEESDSLLDETNEVSSIEKP